MVNKLIHIKTHNSDIRNPLLKLKILKDNIIAAFARTFNILHKDHKTSLKDNHRIIIGAFIRNTQYANRY